MKRVTWHLALVSGACLIAGCGLATVREAAPPSATGEGASAQAAAPSAKDWTDALQPLRLYLARNYLTGGPWMVDLLPAEEVRKALRKEYVFHAARETVFHSYNLRTFCYEISRATGKRFIWIPDDGVDYLKECGDFGVFNSPLESGPMRNTEQGRVCRRSLGSVLQCLVTHLPNLDPPEEKEQNSVWAAWVGRDRIYLVRLPRAHPPEAAAETPPAGESKAAPPATYRPVDALAPPDSDDPLDYFFDTEVVLPSGGEGKAVLKAALPSLREQERLFGRACRVGDGRLAGRYRRWASWLTQGTGMTVTWHTAPTDAWNRDAYEANPDVSKEGPANGSAPSQTTSAARLMWRIINDATECGVARQEPDREIWAGLITEKGFVFLLLPSLYW